MTKKSIAFDKNREYEWLIISQSYLQCALMNARILSKKFQTHEFAISQESPLGYCLKEIYGDYLQSPEYLIFPILFDFKHGMEIYLKSMIGITDSSFSEGHNLIDFLNKANIEDEKIKNIIKKYAFSNLFLPDNKVCDTENEFERYPQCKKKRNPYYDLEIESNITQEKIGELIKDIEFLMPELRKKSLKII